MNDKYKSGEGYHVVPPPYTGNSIPPKPDLVLADKDEYVFSESVTSVPAIATSEVKTIKSKPKSISEPLIKDWISDSENENEIEFKSRQRKSINTKVKFVKSNEHVKSPKDSVKKVENYKQAEYPRKNYQSPRVLMKSGLKTLNTARQNSLRITISVSIARPINTAYPRPIVNSARPVSNTFNRAHSHDRRPLTKFITNKNSNFNEKVNIVRGNVTTVRPKAVVNPQQDLKDKGVIDSGCSRHMTRNKSYLTDYEEIDGGFVAFGGHFKGGKIIGKGKIRTGKLDFKDVYFVKELKFNLFCVSQMCDKKNSVLFTDTECVVLSPYFKLTDESHVFLKVPRKDNMYNVDLKNVVPQGGLTCLFAKATPNESNLWHRRLGHVNFKTMNKLVRGNLVRGLPSKLFEINQTCVACQKVKQHGASCKTKIVNSISQPLQMLHMDLFGLTFVKSLMKKMYCLVVTDDFSRFSWVFFLATKDETTKILKTFITSIENLIGLRVKVIRCDNKTEFKNRVMNQFCKMIGIKREFSVARTPQQNRVAERKNRTLIEAARTMLVDSKLPTTFWAEVVNPVCRKPALSFMRPFGCPVTILNTIDHLGKFDGKADEGFFVGYSTNSKAFRVFNNKTRIVEENMHIKFREDTPNLVGTKLKDNVVDENIVYGCDDDPNMLNLEEIDYSNDDEGVGAEADMKILNSSWIKAMQEELLQFKLQQVWTLVDLPHGKRAIGTKWIYRNKKDKRGIVIRNKARLVAHGHTQEERIDYDEMDVNSAFLYGKIEKEVYVCQPSGFEDPNFPDKVYKVEKALYGLHQAPRACFSDVKIASTPMETHKALPKDPDGEDVDEHLSKSRYKSINMRICQFLGFRLISRQCKKQTVVANSITEAEYIAASNCCRQIKHIEIRYHFIRDSNEKKLIKMIKIHTDQNVTDLLTKAFDVGRFQYPIANLEIKKLKKRVKQLEKKKKSRTLQLKRRLFKVRIESSAEKSLGDQEDASKQGRNEGDQDEGISLLQEDAETQGSTTFTAGVYAGVSVSTAEPNKGKSIMQEPEKPLKKKDQIKLDEELARKLAEEMQVELEEEERSARQREEEANIALIKEIR
ncbi:putative ribonuclease H-like domain-containing protein [Tanacetum coccineum]